MGFPEDRLYSKEGFWLKLEGDTATIGITDWLQEQLSGLASIQYDESSDEEILIVQSQSRSVGFQSFPKPIAGKPVPNGYNAAALEAPADISDFYAESSWLYKLKFDKSSATDLMTAAQFRTFVGQ
jgi:glycine cleavage system H protein